MKRNIRGYDIIRAFAILVVFVTHVLDRGCKNELLLLIEHSLSPDLTMCLLGFISGALLTRKYKPPYLGEFYIKRFLRIYVSFWMCFIVIVFYLMAIGKDVFVQHTIVHAMGLTAFFDILAMKNLSPIGGPLWFITVIVGMYLLLPLLAYLFQHRRGFLHLVAIVIGGSLLGYELYNRIAIWNVIIAFSIGAYSGLNGKLSLFETPRVDWQRIGAAVLLIFICGLARSKIIPFWVRLLFFPIYPLTFIPILFWIAKKLPQKVMSGVSFFSSISYEVYLIHWYLIGEHFQRIFPSIHSLTLQFLIAFCMTLLLSWIVAVLSTKFRRSLRRYFVE